MPQFLLMISPERPSPETVSPGGLGDRTRATIDWIDALRQKDSLESGTLLAKHPCRLSLEWNESKGATRERTLPQVRGPGAPIRYCFSIEASTMDHAIEMASTFPSARPGTIDVFEIEARLAACDRPDRP